MRNPTRRRRPSAAARYHPARRAGRRHARTAARRSDGARHARARVDVDRQVCSSGAPPREGRQVSLALDRGADGANSVVGTSAGALVDVRALCGRPARLRDRHRRRPWRSRLLLEGLSGYGWMFPMAGRRVNLGVGILSRRGARLDVNVPTLFVDFVEHLRRRRPLRRSRTARRRSAGSSDVRRCGCKPFDGGVLIRTAASSIR